MKKGVTLIEIIFVVVVIGILSAIMAPQFTRPSLTEAAHQIVSHIRYTQHLAMLDNKFDPNNQRWYRERWQIRFEDISGEVNYTIYRDLNRDGNIDINETARNPSDSTRVLTGRLIGTNPNTESLNLTEKYNISGFSFTPNCLGDVISFDYLGRPLFGSTNGLTSMYEASGTNRLIQDRCTITLTSEVDNIQIAIEPETGYVHII